VANKRARLGFSMLAALLASLPAVAHCDSKLPVAHAGPVATIAAITSLLDLFAGDRLTAQAAQAVIGGAIEQQGRYWVVRSGGCIKEIVIGATATDTPSADVEIRFGPGSTVKLGDLIAALGPGETVFESKTASVKFELPGSGVAFARLFASRAVPDARVLTLTLRQVPG